MGTGLTSDLEAPLFGGVAGPARAAVDASPRGGLGGGDAGRGILYGTETIVTGDEKNGWESSDETCGVSTKLHPSECSSLGSTRAGQQ